MIQNHNWWLSSDREHPPYFFVNVLNDIGAAGFVPVENVRDWFEFISGFIAKSFSGRLSKSIWNSTRYREFYKNKKRGGLHIQLLLMELVGMAHEKKFLWRARFGGSPQKVDSGFL